MAHPDAGRLPGVHRLGDLQDVQLPARRHRGGRRADLPPRLRTGLQGRDGVPGRRSRGSGALDRLDREAGAREGSDDGRSGRLAEALGRIAELDAELARTRDQLHEEEAENLQRRAKRSRPELLKGSTRRVETPLGTMDVTITEDDPSQPVEAFTSPGQGAAPPHA